MKKKYAKFCGACGLPTKADREFMGFDQRTGAAFSRPVTKCPVAQGGEFDPHYYDYGTAEQPEWDVDSITVTLFLILLGTLWYALQVGLK